MADQTETETTTEPTAATAAEIREGCPGATAEFVLEQIEAQATVTDAQAAFCEYQAERIEELENRVEELEAENSRLEKLQQKRKTTPQAVRMTSSKKTTRQPVAEAGDDAGDDADEGGSDAIAEWNERLKAEVDGGLSKMEATRKLIAEEPDLHEDYLEAYTEQYGQRRR